MRYQKSVFFLNGTATTEIYTTRHTLSLHDALPIYGNGSAGSPGGATYEAAGALHDVDPRSEEHTSELQSRLVISYAVFCLKKKKTTLYLILQHLYILKKK